MGSPLMTDDSLLTSTSRGFKSCRGLLINSRTIKTKEHGLLTMLLEYPVRYLVNGLLLTPLRRILPPLLPLRPIRVRRLLRVLRVLPLRLLPQPSGR